MLEGTDKVREVWVKNIDKESANGSSEYVGYCKKDWGSRSSWEKPKINWQLYSKYKEIYHNIKT